MKKPLIVVAGVEREMNDEEFEQYKKDQAEDIARKEKLAAEEAARQAILDRIGLTADELKTILG
jgi:secreted Zn-dependent insulinase-like peptidase